MKKKKKQPKVEVSFRRINPNDIPIPPAVLLTPKQWSERWRMKMQQAIQMAR